MVKGWLIYSKEDSLRNHSYIDWFIAEANKAELELELVLRENLKIGIRQQKITVDLSDNPAPTLPAFAIVRTIDPLLNRHLENMGVRVFNNAEIAEIANNKALAHLYAAALGIPMVDTLFFKKGTLEDTAPVSYPFIIKQTDGRSGQHVLKIETPGHWKCAKHTFFHADTIIQNTNVQPGKDLRVFVIGKEIIAAVLRENNTDFRANISLGGKASLYTLNTDERKMINKLLYAYDFGLAGIDFLFDHEGKLLFNEIEDAVGSRSLSKLSSINLLQLYVAFIQKKLEFDIK